VVWIVHLGSKHSQQSVLRANTAFDANEVTLFGVSMTVVVGVVAAVSLVIPSCMEGR